jgi:poly-gamma-glutamate capsule biosynthesis protein CapA/YwtB (metallophosphatase superfamily)
MAGSVRYVFGLSAALAVAPAVAPAAQPVCAGSTLAVVAVGDVMLGTAYPSAAYLPPNNDCSPLLSLVKPHIQAADVAFANLEGALTDNLKNAKTCSNPKWCYAFAMPASYAACLADAGFDLLSVANNHTGDFGEQGQASTVNALEQQGIAFAGMLSCPAATIERKGLKIGFCAFAPNAGMCSINNLSAAASIVRTLDSLCNVVIVSFHGGAEGATMGRVTRQTEMFVGENRGNVYMFAHCMIDAGADILLGHGPHVPRAVELYRERFIAYSMGNFCTYSRMNVQGVNGLAPIIKLNVDGKGKFLDGEIVSAKQEEGKPVMPDSAHRAANEIRRLTALDFPESPLIIDEKGKMKAPGRQ